MNPNITEGLSEKQIQNFDIDSIKEVLDKYKKTKELSENEFDIDDNENLSEEEKIILDKLKQSSTIINDLEELINIVDNKQSFSLNKVLGYLGIEEGVNQSKIPHNSIFFGEQQSNNSEQESSIFGISLKSTVETLMSNGNIPDNETLISILDNIQYLVTGEEDKKVGELINLVKNSKEGDWFMRLEVSKYIGEFTGLIGTDLYNEVQKRMIKGAIGSTDKGFTDKYLIGLDKEKGYSLIKIEEFENILNNNGFSNNNDTMLLNYINYLNEKLDKTGLGFKKILDNTLLNDKIKEKIINIYNARKRKIKESYKNLKKNTGIYNDIGNIIKIIDLYFERKESKNERKTNDKTEIYNIINKITDKNILLKSLKYLKSKNPDKLITVTKYVNINLKKELSILKEFTDITGKKLYIYSDIKEIKYENLNNDDKKIFLNLLSDKLLKEIVLINDIEGDNLKNKKLKEKISKIKNDFEEQKNNLLSYEELNDIVDFDESEPEIENTFYIGIKNKDPKIIDIFINKFKDLHYLKIFNLPKVFGLILKDNNLITKIINESNFYIYNTLPTYLQKEHSVEFAKNLIKKEKTESLDIKLAKLQFKNVNQLYIIFKDIITDDELRIKLLEKPLFISNLNIFMQNNKSNIINFKYPTFIEKIMNYIEKNNQKKLEYETIIDNNKKEIDNSGYINIEDYYDYEKIGSYFINDKDTDVRTAKTNLVYIYIQQALDTETNYSLDIFVNDLIRLGIEAPEFEATLKIANILIKQIQQKNNQKLSSLELKENQQKELSTIVTDGKIDTTKLDKKARGFLQANLEIKLDNGNILKYPSNEWTKHILSIYIKEQYPNLDDPKIKGKLIQHLNILISSTTLKTQIKHSDKIYTAYKTGNFDEVNKLLQNDFKDSLLNTNETVSNSNTETTETNTYGSFELNTDNQSPEIKLNSGEKIQISQEEAKIVKSNPEAAENLINFYKFFKELNLESIWDYRKELMIAMGNRNINLLDNNSLSKSELLQFGNNLILAINNLCKNNKELNKKPKLFTSSSLSGIKNELRKFSGAGSILSDEKTSNIQGEDSFAATLRNFGIIGGAYFEINTLRKQIKGK